MDLIITGSNAAYFEHARIFCASLREQGRFPGRVVLCDNTVEGRWDRPGKISATTSFTAEQLRQLQEYDVEVTAFADELAHLQLSLSEVAAIATDHWAYPGKILYCQSIAARYRTSVQRILHCDSDVYIQDDLSLLLNTIEHGRISIAAERLPLRQNAFMRASIDSVNFRPAATIKEIRKQLLVAKNFCSGIFGGSADTFSALIDHAFRMMFEPNTNYLHDQLLINILISHYQFPIEELSTSEVLHLGDIENGKLCFDAHSKTFSVAGTTPVAVHFNGDRKQLLSLLTENSEHAGVLYPTLPIVRPSTTARRASAQVKSLLRVLRTKKNSTQ